MNSIKLFNYYRKLKLSKKKYIIPEKGGNLYQNISLERQESGRKNNICCKGQS